MTPSHKKQVKGWAIYNTKPKHNGKPVMWGYYGVGVSAIQIFSSRKKAQFIMNQSEHTEEVARGTTKIIPIIITLPTKKR